MMDSISFKQLSLNNIEMVLNGRKEETVTTYVINGRYIVNNGIINGKAFKQDP